MIGHGTLDYVAKTFNLSPKDLSERYMPGDEDVKLSKKCRLAPAALGSLKKIVGEANVSTDDFERHITRTGSSSWTSSSSATDG